MKIKDYLEKNYEDSLIALTYLLDTSKSYILLNKDRVLTDKLANKLDQILKDRAKGKPLQYAIGYWEFFGLNLKVDKRALIPRFETEIIVDYIIKSDFKKKSILDIGTGSGAIALALASNIKETKILASDVKKEALDLAEINRKRLGIENVSFVKSDLFENISGKFDIIVSNPPYINEDDYKKLDKVLYYEPKSALLAKEDGLYYYKRIIKEANIYLNDGAMLIFEIGYDQKDRIEKFLNESDFKNIVCIKDYNDFDRFIVAEKG
ncbi:MAG: peptide chain release factor N(5)-glutamine methyltransferase [Anaerococcus sp.]|nr:peptide chain release factor N(5)-glutamine methyltransferase [Anaerococcus sp.]